MRRFCTADKQVFLDVCDLLLKLYTAKVFYLMLIKFIIQMNVRDALNSALDEEMAADPKVYLMGEEVGIILHLFFSNPFIIVT
mgnify:FL=1